MSFNNANVVMLPTDQKTNGMICKDITGQDKIIAIKTKYLMAHEDYVGHHLYIISDDKIKKGDWFFDKVSNSVNKCHKIVDLWIRIEGSDKEFFKSNCQKIITTTDESLYYKDISKNPKQYMGSYMSMSLGEKLPQPSQQFIEKYIEEYNKGNVITDILVEYNSYNNHIDWSLSLSREESHYLHKMYDMDMYDTDNIEKDWKRVFELEKHNFNKLKINPKDNTITIKIVKDCYTREEVDRLLDEQASKTTAEMLEKFKGYKSKDDEDLRIAFENFACEVYNENYKKDTSFRKRAERMSKKWIEENL